VLRATSRNGPVSLQDRWEENAGISPFTLAIEIVALVVAADFLNAEDRAYALSLADYRNERVEELDPMPSRANSSNGSVSTAITFGSRRPPHKADCAGVSRSAIGGANPLRP
jgi:hypothetical protein